MNPDCNVQVARMCLHINRIDANRETILSAISALRGMFALGSVDREVLDGALAILEIVESIADATEDETLALEICLDHYWDAVKMRDGERIRRQMLAKKRKTAAVTETESKATRTGDGDEHAE